MNLFDVYPLFPIEPVKAENAYLWDSKGNKYLDLYGGHAVISIGHSHPYYVKQLSEQLQNIGFYSNSVRNNLQVQLAQKLGELSECEEYQLFLCNSGAEANENALKLASFYNQRKKIIAFRKAFHGRTSLGVSATDNPKISAAINSSHHTEFIDFEDFEKANEALSKGDVCAVIIEAIQGVGGVEMPSTAFLQHIEKLCKENDTVLILDEVQAGYGRSGKFFSFQHASIEPDLITVAKGMGNGFPIGGVLIHPKFKPWYGMLGTTFGGNHLACVAGLSVLEVIEEEKLMPRAQELGDWLLSELTKISEIKKVKGKGLMIGLDFDFPIKELRSNLLLEHKIFTGASGQYTLRLLPPLTVAKQDLEHFISKLKLSIQTFTEVKTISS